MAEDLEGPRRRRWLVPAVLVLGAGAWAVRARRAAAAELPGGWPVPHAGPASPPEHVPVPEPAPGPAPAPAPAPSRAAALATTPVGPTSSAAAVPPGAERAERRPRPTPRTRRPAPDLPAGAAVPLPDGSAPGPEYTIKGNAGSMLFHGPGSPYYKRTKPELWFRTADDARAAGYTEWVRKARST